MKKIISIVLLLALVACSLVACKKDNGDNTPAEKTYTLSVVADDGLKTISKGSATVIALALVYDADGKIVAARFDSVQPKFALNADKTDLATVARVETKVEQGDSYDPNNSMKAGKWYAQAQAFENFLIGKTAADVAALDTSNVGPDNPIVAGCTMSASTPVFQALVAKAFAYTRNVTFTTSETVTLGLAIDCAVSGSVKDNGKAAFDVAGVAVAGGKVVASMLDSAECAYTLAITEGTDKSGNPTTSLTVTPGEYKGTKNEQGDAYDAWKPMAGGRWYAQAQAFANATVGKDLAGVEAIDATTVAGCTIYAGGYKAVLVRALGYAR